jgi:hypothetical protein
LKRRRESLFPLLRLPRLRWVSFCGSFVRSCTVRFRSCELPITACSHETCIVLSMMKHGKKSWKPWFISLLLDLASRGCSWDADLNEGETQEMYRRGFLWFFYLIRSPFFEFAVGDPTEPGSRISRLFELLQRVPLVGALSGTSKCVKYDQHHVLDISHSLIVAAASLAEFFLVYRKRYFYTAGSSS